MFSWVLDPYITEFCALNDISGRKYVSYPKWQQKCLKHISEYELRYCSVLLKNSCVEDEKILKCCAHVILNMEKANNKEFCDT